MALAYKLRFVQKFQEAYRKEFLELEARFLDLEKKYSDFPKGRRYLPYSARESNNTFIWECEFHTLEEVQNTLAFLRANQRHEELFALQSKYLLDSYVPHYPT